MSILNRLIQERTGAVRPDYLRVTAECVATGNEQPSGFGVKKEYVLTFGVRALFWANDAEHSAARKQTERVLLHKMYGDTLALLDEARKAIFDGEPAEALSALEKIRNDLTKP